MIFFDLVFLPLPLLFERGWLVVQTDLDEIVEKRHSNRYRKALFGYKLDYPDECINVTTGLAAILLHIWGESLENKSE